MRGTTKFRSWVLMMVVLVFTLVSSTMAFHDTAKLVCNKCHTMHYSEDGTDPIMAAQASNVSGVSPVTGGPNPHLLYYASITDLCLACHSGDVGADIDGETAWSVYSATVPTPGGDFAESNGVGITGNGHNPYYTSSTITTSFIGADEVTGKELTPPGNDGQVLAKWTCTSCHSAHGGSSECFEYRNLKLVVNNGDGSDTDDVDVDSTIGSDNNDEADPPNGSQYNVYRNFAPTDYSTKFGAWCGACHGEFHGDETNDLDIYTGGNWVRHPTAYAIGDLGGTGKNYSGIYDPLVPLVAGPSDTWTPGGTSDAVDGDEEVFCLSCHKAHATDEKNLMRWASDAVGNTSCNKCHKKGS